MTGGNVSAGEPQDDALLEAPAGNAWRALMDSSSDAYVCIGAAGEVVEWNRMAEAIFGWSRAEAVGRPLSELIIPPEFVEAHREGLRRFVATGNGEVVFQRLELPALRRDGQRLDVVFTILPAQTGAGAWRFHAFLHDVTGERRRERYLRLLQQVAITANEATAVEPAVRAVLEQVRVVSGSELAHIYRLDREDAQRLAPTGWWSPGPKEPLSSRTAGMVFAFGEGLPGRAAASGRPAWIADIREDPNFPRMESARATGVLAAFSFPVTTRGRTVAVIELFRARPSEPEHELLEVMETVGAQLGRVFEREEALDDLRTIAAEREAIVAIVGHELRGPLAAAHTAAGMLGEELADTARRSTADLVDLLDRQLGRLRRLVDMFLTAQRLESGALQVHPQPVELATVAEEVVGDGAFEGVTIDVPSGAVVTADPDHVAQVLWNLLSNATRHGRPPIIIDLAERDEHTTVLRVADAGEGVSAELRARLFERFTRTTRSQGSGLGLSIVRGLARANGGEATYRSEGRPAFLVTLPTA